MLVGRFHVAVLRARPFILAFQIIVYNRAPVCYNVVLLCYNAALVRYNTATVDYNIAPAPYNIVAIIYNIALWGRRAPPSGSRRDEIAAPE